MIPGADNHGRALGNGRRALAGHPRKPRAEILQSSQTTRRLAKPEVPRSRFFGGGFVGRGYLSRELHYPVFEGHG